MTSNKKFSTLVSSLLLAALLICLTSCNKGVGCPSNFSLKTVTAALK